MSFREELIGILDDLQGIWTESILIFSSILILLVGLIKPRKEVIKGIFALAVIFGLFLHLNNELTGEIMLDNISLSIPSTYFGSLFLFTSLSILIFKREKEHVPEFYFFILAMLIGSLFTMKANSLLIVYISIELVSLSSYILTNFSFKKEGHEASIKYLLFGSISSAIMLFGLALIYGTTGTFFISDWSPELFSQILVQVGVMMFLIGIFFKISIVPVHLWVPATYQSAPVDAIAFMSIVPNMAALILLQRIFSMDIFHVNHWIFNMVLSLGMLTIMAGTLGAFRQKNARRMVSFGAVAHSGFMLPFVLMNTTTAQEAFWWYAVAYAMMNLAVFYILHSYEKKKIEIISDYRISSQSVWMGVTFTVVLISLAGFPPFAGFTAKFFLFTTLWEFYVANDSNMLLWYLIISVLATVGSLFFYLQIPKNIFLVNFTFVRPINFSLLTKIIATLFSIVLLLLFLVPNLIMVMQQVLRKFYE